MKKADKLARAARARALLMESDDAEKTETKEPHRAPEPRKTSARPVEQTDAVSRQPTNQEIASRQTIKPPRLIPRRYSADQLQRGTMVFYCGARMWVEQAPKSWDETSFITIGDAKVPPGPEDFNRPLKEDRISHCVHADCIEIIDPATIPKTRLPTVKSVATAKRAKEGKRDIGDEIANLLRGCVSLLDVYEAASKYLGIDVSELQAKYGHLNPGQQRMNLGNKMRFKWRKEHE